MINKRINSSILKKIKLPNKKSHKGQNGRLLIIAGSKKYHGSLYLSSLMASKIVDFVYVHTTKENFEIIKKLRQKLAEFIYINKKDLKPVLDKEADAILIGPGIALNEQNKKLIKNILTNYKDVKTLLDAGALRLLDPKWLHKNCVLTPHTQEFKKLFKIKENLDNAIQMSKKYPATIVLKGRIDYICQNGKVFKNYFGNAGMTKGGTGDVLAGILAGLMCKNDVLTSVKSALWLNGKAGDNLKKKVSYFYSASELVPEIQKILGKNL